MSTFHAMSNVFLATEEASVNLGNAEEQDLMYTANIAITISESLTAVMTSEQLTIQESMDGTYVGSFDNNNGANDPGLYTGSSDDITETQALISEESSYYQNVTQMTSSTLSSETGAIQSEQQKSSQIQQFQGDISDEQNFLDQLISSPMS